MKQSYRRLLEEGSGFRVHRETSVWLFHAVRLRPATAPDAFAAFNAPERIVPILGPRASFEQQFRRLAERGISGNAIFYAYEAEPAVAAR